MKLANLEPLTKNILREYEENDPLKGPTASQPVQPKPKNEAEAAMGSDRNEEPVSDAEGEEATAAEPEGDDDLEMSGDESHDETAGEPARLNIPKEEVMTLIELILQAANMKGEVTDAGEGSGDEVGMDDMAGDMGGDEQMPPPGEEMELQETEELEETEELDERKKKAAEKTAAEKTAKKSTPAGKPAKKMEEGLSEDSLVEAVLARVTARLMQEAKKQKQSTKDKMKQRVQEKLMQEASESKGGGPLVNKGGNKYDTYKGHPDMEMGKGENGGKGGHKLEKVTAKAEHTVTHGGKNLATLGGNKA